MTSTERPLSKDQVSEAAEIANSFIKYAYDQGMHEVGIDPVKELTDEIDRLQHRLELIAPDGTLLPESCDGISARDETIKLLDQRIERLQRELAKPAHEREPPHCSNCSCGLPAEPPAGWQPIETVPPTDRNNPVYVAYPHFSKDNKTMVPDEYSCFTAYCDNLGWDSGFWRLHEKPHYWHPLPKAPTVMRDGLLIGRTTETTEPPRCQPLLHVFSEPGQPCLCGAVRWGQPSNTPVPEPGPFTVEKFGSLAAAVTAERDWLRSELARLSQPPGDG